MKRNLLFSLAAVAALSAAAPRPALAQLGSAEARCVTTMQKDGLRVASARAKQIAACVSGAQDGSVTDLAACLAATDEKVTAALTRGNDDAEKSCGATPPDFGLPAAYDDTINEAAQIHANGLLADLLGASPSIATGADGKCQAAVLKATQKFVATYRKDFAKCVGTTLKGGAVDGAALVPCLSPDLASGGDKLVASITKACSASTPATVLPGVCSSATGATVGDCIKVRARCRACREAATMGALDGDCDLVDDATANNSCSFPVTVSGNAFNFSNYTRLAGSTVWVLEHPELTTITDAEGYFEFPTIQEGEEVTLVLEDPAFHPLQNGTIRVGAAGAQRVTFQAVTWGTYDALAMVLAITPDELTKCQMVTTVTRVGKSIYDTGAHGEVAATVTTVPELPHANGPIYFGSDVLPGPSLTRTSDDGGTLMIQIPPGDYVWTAHKGNLVFTRIKTKCRAGLLVNASPPWGLQRH